ncbi:hypothetical protein T4B_4802 [Trichinella pseudospiralis]|uniref:Uncharacterized protein n=1 Tax=Trichinella pseudospiralis TaxID=6337 RepID=A0A0V1GL53_TRIPS|nr:hypothetical protein T4B_4802 [Trichinella pseudospiralis]
MLGIFFILQIYALAAIDDFLRNWIKSPVWGFDIPKAERPRNMLSGTVRISFLRFGDNS